jgi:hypothetical protein
MIKAAEAVVLYGLIGFHGEDGRRRAWLQANDFMGLKDPYLQDLFRARCLEMWPAGKFEYEVAHVLRLMGEITARQEG